MALLPRLIAGTTALFRRTRADRELDEELRAFLEASIEEKMRAGMRREEAIRAARAEFGSIAAVKDHTRDVGWETRLENLWRDMRYAARTLRRSPTFTTVAVLTLALGIGANTAIFSAVNAVMLRRLPVERPQELISLAVVYPNGVEPVFSYAAYRTLATEGGNLIDPIAASTVHRDAIAVDGPPEPVDLEWVSGNYFTTFGISAALGRTLLTSDDPFPPGEPVAVISDAYWARRFGREPTVIGRHFRLRATTFAIVGVAPPAFSGESAAEAADIWMPLSAQPGAPAWLWTGHSTTWLQLLARRRPGISFAQAGAGLGRVYERIRDEMAAGADGPEFRRSVLGSRLIVSEGSRGSSRVRDNLSAPLLILMAIVGLVLVVACANVANLMLARAAARRRETAVCLAIGAARSRLVRQSMAEALLLALLGGLAGVTLALWGTSILKGLISGALPIALDVQPDTRVLAFAALTSCATAILFGLLPALRTTRIDPLDGLKAGASGRGVVRIPLGRSLVVVQVVVSLVLLVAAALFVRSLVNLRHIDPGFDPDRVVIFRMTPPQAPEPVAAEVRRNLYRQVLERAEAIHGVEGASASFSGLLSGDTWGNAITVEGFTPGAGVTPRTFANSVTPRYFDVMRIAVLRGRGFTTGDHDNAPKVTVVNETFARRFFGTADPIGKRVGLCTSDPCRISADAMMEIVGVTEDIKYTNLREERRSMLYVPFTQAKQNLSEIQVRTSGDPAAVAPTIYRELAAVDSRLAIVSMLQARDRVDASIVPERMVAKLSAAFGLLALALAGVGLYGLIAYMTTQRTGEIGIRMALGARRRDVRRLVLGDTMKIVALGTVIGIPAALIGARLLSGLLYQVGPSDPIAVALSLGALSVAAMVAGYLPTRRATRVDPSTVLRAE